MGFLKKFFGGEKKEKEYVDTRGVYFYVRCTNCGSVTRLRADKEYDLSREGSGYVWYKTIIDNRCFRPIETVVTLDGSYAVTNADISGGEYVTKAEYDASLKPEGGINSDPEVGNNTDSEDNEA